MRSFWKHSLMLACVGLLLAAPLPSFSAPPAPDYAVTIGPVVKTALMHDPALGEVWSVDVTVTNVGNLPGAATFEVYLSSSVGPNPNQVCAGKQYFNTALWPPQSTGNPKSVTPLRFQVTYHGKVFGAVPLEKPGAQLPHDIQVSLNAWTAGYDPAAVYETNLLNNVAYDVKRAFRAGGTPGCIVLP